MKKQVVVAVVAGVLTIGFIIGAALGIYSAIVNFGTTTITVFNNKEFQTIKGFGASSAWTYQALGAIEDDSVKQQAIDMLYGDYGLKLNTFRYNIGGGGKELGIYENKGEEKGKDPLRGAESYFVAENFHGDYAAFSDAANYDFTRDKAVREMFEKALATGNIDEVVFFVNSPHYLLTRNGLTHGNEAYDNNLKEECYQAFSDYVLIITDWLYSNLICKYDKDIKVYISPVNEPQWKWNGSGVPQEGCHYDPDVLAKFYDVFHKTLVKFNASEGTSFIMDIFESGNYKLTESGTKFKRYMKAFSKYDYFDEIDTISVHSYGTDTDKRTRNMLFSYLTRDMDSRKVSVSEYCVMESGVSEGIDMGLYSAKVILRDLALIDAVSWNYWLSVSMLKEYDYEDGLVYWNTQDNSLSAYKRYYAMGQFSKFIEPGSVRLGTEYGDTLGMNGVECVAFRKTDGTTAVIVINDSKREHVLNVVGVGDLLSGVTTDADRNWAQVDASGFASGKVKVSAKSITTFVFSAPVIEGNA